jgi:hypothetical protein
MRDWRSLGRGSKLCEILNWYGLKNKNPSRISSKGV